MCACAFSSTLMYTNISAVCGQCGKKRELILSVRGKKNLKNAGIFRIFNVDMNHYDVD